MIDGDTSPVIWVPRPVEDAIEVSEDIHAMGLNAFVEPVMTIRYLDATPDLENVTGLIFTSANGVRAFTRAMPDRHIPVFAVGPQCAATAQKAGFTSVVTAGGDVEKLAETIIEHRSPEDGVLLHVAGTARAGDLSGALESKGYTIRRSVLYSADLVDTLPETVRQKLNSRSVAAVLLFSPRTAGSISHLVDSAGLTDTLGTVHAVCLSVAVAEKLSSDRWASITVANDRSRGSILETLKAITGLADTGNSDGNSEIDKNNQQNHKTEPVSTPTVGTGTNRTYHEGTANNEKGEGASRSMDAEHVIEQFGGIRPMAQKLGIAVSTVQGWKTRNHIPENRWEDVRAAAAESGIDLEGIVSTGSSAESEEPAEIAESPWKSDNEAEEPETAEPETQDEEQEEAHVAEASSDSLETEEKPSSTQTAPPPPPAKPSRSGGGGWALFLALVALAGIATRGYWGPAVDPKVEAHLTNFFGPPVVQQATAVDETIKTDLVRTQEVIAAMLKRLEDIEQRADALGGSFEGGDVSSVSIDAVNDRISALEDRLDSAPTVSEDGSVDLAAIESALAALRTRMGSLDGKADASIENFQLEINTFGDRLAAIGDDLAAANSLISGIGDRLAVLENSPGNPAIGSSALVLVVGQLEMIADTGAPFAEILPSLQELAGDEAETQTLINSLKEASWTGVKPLSVLTTRFGDIATSVDAAETARVGGDWVDESLAALQSVVSVRRIDDAPDAPAATRAEAALSRGDLAAAVAAVEPFGNADEDIAAWLADANARLSVDATISALRIRAVDRLRAMATTN